MERKVRVRVSFVVDNDGSLTDIKIVNSLSPTADAEVLRVIKLSPKWKPGTQDGRTVRVQYTTTIPMPFDN